MWLNLLPVTKASFIRTLISGTGPDRRLIANTGDGGAKTSPLRDENRLVSSLGFCVFMSLDSVALRKSNLEALSWVDEAEMLLNELTALTSNSSTSGSEFALVTTEAWWCLFSGGIVMTFVSWASKTTNTSSPRYETNSEHGFFRRKLMYS